MQKNSSISYLIQAKKKQRQLKWLFQPQAKCGPAVAFKRVS